MALEVCDGWTVEDDENDYMCYRLTLARTVGGVDLMAVALPGFNGQVTASLFVDGALMVIEMLHPIDAVTKTMARWGTAEFALHCERTERTGTAVLRDMRK